MNEDPYREDEDGKTHLPQVEEETPCIECVHVDKDIFGDELKYRDVWKCQAPTGKRDSVVGVERFDEFVKVRWVQMEAEGRTRCLEFQRKPSPQTKPILTNGQVAMRAVSIAGVLVFIAVFAIRTCGG